MGIGDEMDMQTVFDKTGRQIEKILVAEPWTANLCFGGRDRRTLFITAPRLSCRL